MNQTSVCEDNIKISCIGNKEYLIEASVAEAKLVCEVDEFDISSVSIMDGPKIIVGQDFNGVGTIHHIGVLRNNPQLPLLLRVVLA